MIINRHRGLVRIHGIAVLLAVAIFFLAYAEFIMTWVPMVKLSREVNLVPYFLCVVIGMLAGNGRIRSVGSRLTRLGGVEAAGVATAEVALMALAIFSMMFATQDRSISRLFLGTFLLSAWFGLFWLHQTLPQLLARWLFRQGGRIPTLFVGRAGSLPLLKEWIAQRSHLGVSPVGFIAYDQTVSALGDPAEISAGTGDLDRDVAGGAEAPLLGAVADLPRLMQANRIGQVILLELPENNAIARQVIDFCQAQGCRLLIHHQVDEALGHPVVSVDEGGRHFFTLHEEPLEEPLNRAVKRLFDIVVALPAVVLVLPVLMPVVWLMQRLQAPGPLFHTRARSGEGRVEFSMLKFRSMHVASTDADLEGRQAQAGDARIYPFGHFLRRHSLDEFPQFWNVLLGNMSVVGPRPVMPALDQEFERQVRAYRSKHWVKPGITGLAQSEGFRGEIQTPEQLQERIRLDLYYIVHWSVWLDLQITLKTFRQIFMPPQSAY